VAAICTLGGDWQLDTTSPSRAVWLDLGDLSLPFQRTVRAGQEWVRNRDAGRVLPGELSDGHYKAIAVEHECRLH